MKPLELSLLSLAFAAFVAACGGESAPKSPEPATSAAPASTEPAPPATASAEPAPATTAPAASAAAAAPAAPAGKSIKDTVGTVSKIEVMSKGKKKTEMSKQADVDALLKAIGTDQVPSGAVRRCPDDWVVVMKDKDGKEQGNVGLCNAETLGPEFFAPKGDRKGITLADEAAVRKMLKIEAPKAAPTPPKK